MFFTSKFMRLFFTWKYGRVVLLFLSTSAVSSTSLNTENKPYLLDLQTPRTCLALQCLLYKEVKTFYDTNKIKIIYYKKIHVGNYLI